MREPRAEVPRIPGAYGVPTDGSGGDCLSWSRTVEQLMAARNYWIGVLCPRMAQRWTEKDHPRTATRWVFPG